MDMFTKLTFFFIGLFFVTYMFYMFSSNIVLLNDKVESHAVQVVLWLFNILFYLFENLALLFNISKWGFAIRMMDPKVGYHRIKMTSMQKAIACFLVASSAAFFIAELSFDKPYPEVCLLLF
jgi:hypothetical protein